MASKLQFNAERPQDYVIRETPKLEDDSWLLAQNKNAAHPLPWRNPATIGKDTDFPPRVIRVLLSSFNAVERSELAITWALAFPQMENLRPGTILHWADISIQEAAIPDSSWIDVALSGIRTTSINTNNTSFTFECGATILLQSPSNFVQLGGSTPVAATCMDLDILNSGRITVHNLNLNEPWTPTTAVQTTLVFIEPGAKVY